MPAGLIISFVFGAIIGSFLNVLILRLPRSESIGGHSYCVHCKHRLGAFDLVPLFSFLNLKGKCRYCGKPISKRYFLIEMVTGLLFVFSFLKISGLDLISLLVLLKYFIVCSVMLTVFVIDYEHYLILDSVVFVSAALLFAANLAIDIASKTSWSNSLAFNGILAAAGLYLFFGAIYFISKGRWMGFGDVKFSLALGMATVFPLIVVNVFLAFMLGSLVGLLLLSLRLKKIKSEMPFGTFLAASTVVTLFYGPQMLNWYLNLIGLRIYV